VPPTRKELRELQRRTRSGRLQATAPIGELLHVAHLTPRGGLSLRITLRANVVQPDVRLSTDALHFGSVRTGCCKVRGATFGTGSAFRLEFVSQRASATLHGAENILQERAFFFCPRMQVMTVAVTNPEPVPADWALGLPRDQGGAPVFVIAPCSGTLAPGQSNFVQARREAALAATPRLLSVLVMTRRPCHRHAALLRLGRVWPFVPAGPRMHTAPHPHHRRLHPPLR